MLYPHWSQIPATAWRWLDFRPNEPNLACPHCGEFYLHEPSMDALQMVRNIVAGPVRVNSGHRCAFHNVFVGGAPLSEHRKVAFDMSTRNRGRQELLRAARVAGFRGFGYYTTFLHVDMGRSRFWYGGDAAKEAWRGIVD